MFHINKPLRRLSMLLQSLPNAISDDPEARATVHRRLLRWCESQEYGWLVDNAEDKLDLTTHQLYGFDQELFVLSGTPDRAEQVETLIQQVGADPQIWLPLFFQQIQEGQSPQDVPHA